eukprot:scaffold334_cov241-Pinguiococcus_pyrenoidosus.AAC.14
MARSVLLSGLLAGFVSVRAQNFQGFDDVELMPIARSDMTATAVAEHGQDDRGPRVYLIGGCVADQQCPPDDFCFCPDVTARVIYYVPREDRYEVGVMDAPRSRYRHAAALSNNKIYLFGGRTAEDAIVTPVDVFDIATGQWSTPCDWPVGMASSDLTAFEQDGRIFVVGGYDESYGLVSDLYEFLPDSCSFVPRAAMPTARGDISAETVQLCADETSIRHFVIGGFAMDFCAPEAVVESYSVAEDRWYTHGELIIARGDKAVGHIQNQLFAIGGETKDNPDDCLVLPVDDVERFVPSEAPEYTGEWVFEDPVPQNRFRFVAASVEEKIFLFGGQTNFVESLPGSGLPGYPISNTTMLYTPKTFRDSDDLGDGEIAGGDSEAYRIVIAAVVVACAIVLAILTYLAARKYRGYQQFEKKETKKTWTKEAAKVDTTEA